MVVATATKTVKVRVTKSPKPAPTRTVTITARPKPHSTGGRETGASRNCTPGYSHCLAPASDYDCRDGGGNGPRYTGPVRVTGSDPYDQIETVTESMRVVVRSIKSGVRQTIVARLELFNATTGIAPLSHPHHDHADRPDGGQGLLRSSTFSCDGSMHRPDSSRPQLQNLRTSTHQGDVPDLLGRVDGLRCLAGILIRSMAACGS